MTEAYKEEESRCKEILESLYEEVTLLSSDEHIAFSVAKPKNKNARDSSRNFEITYIRGKLKGLDNPAAKEDGKRVIITTNPGENTFKVTVHFDYDKP